MKLEPVTGAALAHDEALAGLLRRPGPR